MYRILGVFIALMLVIQIPASAAATTPVPVIFNGSEIDVEALLIDDYTFIPLRDVLSLLEDVDIAWDNDSKTVAISHKAIQMKLIIGEVTASTEIGMGYEYVWYIDPPAIIVNDRAVVPLRFLSDVFFARIYYENGRVFLNFPPFKFEDGVWYENHWYGNHYGWREILDSSKYKKVDDVIYCIASSPTEPLWASLTALLALHGNGRFELLRYLDSMVVSFSVFNGTAFYQRETSPLGGRTSIEKKEIHGELISGTRLGHDDYSYGSRIDVVRDNNPNGGYYLQQHIGHWSVEPDAVYAIGFYAMAAPEGLVRDLNLFKETYGYYKLYDDGTHELIEILETEFK